MVKTDETHIICFRARYTTTGSWGYESQFLNGEASGVTSPNFSQLLTNWQQLSTQAKRQANPQSCDLETHYIRGFDGVCLAKNYSTQPQLGSLELSLGSANIIKEGIFIDNQVRAQRQAYDSLPSADIVLQIKGILS